MGQFEFYLLNVSPFMLDSRDVQRMRLSAWMYYRLIKDRILRHKPK